MCKSEEAKSALPSFVWRKLIENKNNFFFCVVSAPVVVKPSRGRSGLVTAAHVESSLEIIITREREREIPISAPKFLLHHSTSTSSARSSSCPLNNIMATLKNHLLITDLLWWFTQVFAGRMAWNRSKAAKFNICNTLSCKIWPEGKFPFKTRHSVVIELNPSLGGAEAEEEEEVGRYLRNTRVD